MEQNGVKLLFQVSTDELPKFTPTFDGGGTALVGYNKKHTDTTAGFASGGLWAETPKTLVVPFNSIGNNIPHNNIQPSVASYCWKRTA